MNIKIWGLLLVLGLAGCASEPAALSTESQKTQKENHFVLVQLPQSDTLLGTKVTLSLEGASPLIKTFAPLKLGHTAEDYQLRFEVGETVRPGTLAIDYPNGESHTMNQVVFDTPIRPPKPSNLSSTEP